VHPWLSSVRSRNSLAPQTKNPTLRAFLDALNKCRVFQQLNYGHIRLQ
jgi:hypothetical protein